VLLYSEEYQISKEAAKMPNWIHNAITLEGDRDKLDAFQQKLKGENGSVDFNRIVPMPPHSDTFYADGPLGETERERYGKHNWYDWSMEHWGTKWNACEPHLSQGKRLSYDFYTAWDAPRPLIEPITALAQSLGLTMRWECRDEGGVEVVLHDTIPGDVK